MTVEHVLAGCTKFITRFVLDFLYNVLLHCCAAFGKILRCVAKLLVLFCIIISYSVSVFLSVLL